MFVRASKVDTGIPGTLTSFRYRLYGQSESLTSTDAGHSIPDNFWHTYPWLLSFQVAQNGIPTRSLRLMSAARES